MVLLPKGRGTWGGGDCAQSQPMVSSWGWPWPCSWQNVALGLCPPKQWGDVGVSRVSQAPGHPMAANMVVPVMHMWASKPQ